MRAPTTEQQTILESTSRVRIVRAVPGSGKTWLVAELIRKELGHWTAKGSGIAALSFTHVGGDEILHAVGHELEHPHFVGTIDAFLFRYIVRPHFRRCYPGFADPRIIPGEWGADRWNYYGANQSTTVGRGINLFGCVFIDEEQGEVVIAHKPHPSLPLQRLTGHDLIKVKEGKKRLWKGSGCLTHSDAALIASKILAHQTYGAIIRAEILRRFPLIIVDELQDTGFFLGRCLRTLLNEQNARGVLVGDPDQAIFEFNGARPDLFEAFESIEGSVTLPLSYSRRCPSSIAKVANYLKDSKGIIGTDNNQSGQAFILKYTDMKSDIGQLVSVISQKYSGKNIKIVARSNETVVTLIGRHSALPPRLGCPALFHVHLSVMYFRQGRQVSALANASTALSLAIFKHEGVTDNKLKQSGIDPFDWKSVSIRCLLRANALATIGNAFDWQKAAGEIIDSEIRKFILNAGIELKSGDLRPQKRNGWDKPSTDCLPQCSSDNPSLTSIPIQTVHSVKGQTHDTTILVCPPADRIHCPSIVWWSANEKHREERRIAYVAMTRTQGDLIVCVSEASFQRLTNTQPQFVANFNCMAIEEFVAV